MEAIIFLIVGVLGTAVTITWEGFVLTKLWAWFVVPTFGLPMLTIPIAIGICIIAAFLTHQQNFKLKSGDEMMDALNAYGYSIFTGAVLLFIGWVVTFFI